jgi:hydroxyacylglutathione hydrolase
LAVTSLTSRNRLKLKAIILTHPHADFVAGHAELAARSGASIYISEKAPATFVHHDLKEGDRLALGEVELEVIDTPGHSPDSICLSVLESGQPVALFSGDTLFAGDVGRPDLRDGEMGSHELAAMLQHSLFDKLLKLPPGLKVYPAPRRWIALWKTDFVRALRDDWTGSGHQLGTPID